MTEQTGEFQPHHKDCVNSDDDHGRCLTGWGTYYDRRETPDLLADLESSIKDFSSRRAPDVPEPLDDSRPLTMGDLGRGGGPTITERQVRAMHKFTEKKPTHGQRIIVEGAWVSGGVPATEGGIYATYHGMTNGHVVLEGTTSDQSFADPTTATWRPREDD